MDKRADRTIGDPSEEPDPYRNPWLNVTHESKSLRCPECGWNHDRHGRGCPYRQVDP